MSISLGDGGMGGPLLNLLTALLTLYRVMIRPK